MDSGPRDQQACQDVPFVASVNSPKELQGNTPAWQHSVGLETPGRQRVTIRPYLDYHKQVM